VNAGTAQAPAAEETSGTSKASAAPLAPLALLYVAATAIYAVLARQSPVPLLFPDEGIYGSLAQSLADGKGLTIRSVEVDLNSTLYVYLIAPAWKLTSGSDAFALAQTIGAALLCLTVFPVWLLARRYVGPWLALVPALLVVSGSWMLTAAGLLTENASLPLTAASLAATAVALSRPGSRWAFAAVGFALLAAFARAQLAVLFPVILLAVALDCARYWRGWRERLAAHRVIALLSGGITLIGLFAVVVSPDSTLGIYERFQGGAQPGPMGKAIKDQLTGLLAMAAVLPLVIVAAGSASRDAWRDERLGPLLAVTWATVLLFLGQSAWALTTFLENGLVPWHIQRYIEYPLPLLLVAMTVVIVWRRVAVRELAIAGAVATLVLLATPGVRDVQEERGLFGLQERVDSILGTSAGVSLALVSALLVAVALIATARLRDRPTAALGVVSVSILTVFLVQAQVLWPWQNRVTDSFRAGLPANLSWVDDEVGGDVARIIVLDNPTRATTTEFFNRDVSRVYTPANEYFGRRVNGLQCPWAPNEAGVVEWGAACGAAPRRLLLDNDYSKIEFHDQKVLASQPGIGRVIELNAAPPLRPRLRSVLRVPCGPAIPGSESGGHGRVKPPRKDCFPLMSGAFWMDEPARLVLRFRGGKDPKRVSFSNGARVETIKPRTTTTLRFPIPAGSSSFGAQLEWQQSGPNFPELIGAEIVGRDGSVSELLY